jgi:hypothetical protein
VEKGARLNQEKHQKVKSVVVGNKQNWYNKFKSAIKKAVKLFVFHGLQLSTIFYPPPHPLLCKRWIIHPSLSSTPGVNRGRPQHQEKHWQYLFHLGSTVTNIQYNNLLCAQQLQFSHVLLVDCPVRSLRSPVMGSTMLLAIFLSSHIVGKDEGDWSQPRCIRVFVT